MVEGTAYRFSWFENQISMFSYSSVRPVSVGRSSRFTHPSSQARIPIRAGPFQPDVPRERGVGRGHEWLQKLWNKFGPPSDRSKTALVLDFEKPLINLDQRINEVLDFNDPKRTVGN